MQTRYFDTYELVIRWWRWQAVGNGIPRCASQMASLYNARMGSTVPTLRTSDDVAMIIEAAVTALRMRDNEAFAALMVSCKLGRYASNEDASAVLSERVGYAVGKEKYRNLLNYAISRIDGYLDRVAMEAA